MRRRQVLTAAVTALAVIFGFPTLASAAKPTKRLKGAFDVKVVTVASVNGSPVGNSATRTFKFSPTCASGVCAVIMRRDLGSDTASYRLRPSGDGTYKGSLTFFDDCHRGSLTVPDGYRVQESVSIRPLLVRNKRLMTISGSLRQSWSPTSIGSQVPGCRAGSDRFNLPIGNASLTDAERAPGLASVTPVSGSAVSTRTFTVTVTATPNPLTLKPITKILITGSGPNGSAECAASSTCSGTFEFTAAGAGTVRYTITDAGLGARSGTINYTSAPGALGLTITSPAGGASITGTSLPITVAIDPAQVGSQTMNLSASIDGAVAGYFSMAGGTTSTSTSISLSGLTAGTHTLTVMNGSFDLFQSATSPPVSFTYVP